MVNCCVIIGIRVKSFTKVNSCCPLTLYALNFIQFGIKKRLYRNFTTQPPDYHCSTFVLK